MANRRPADPIAFLAAYLQNFSIENKTPSTKEASATSQADLKPSEPPKRRNSVIKQTSMDNIEEAPPVSPEDTSTPNNDDRVRNYFILFSLKC